MFAKHQLPVSSTPLGTLKGGKFSKLIGPEDKMMGVKLQSSFKNLHSSQNLSKQKTNIKVIPSKINISY